MGKHSNIFYLDNKHKIIAVGKQIKSSQSSFRTISTGSIYSGPPVNLKKQPREDAVSYTHLTLPTMIRV